MSGPLDKLAEYLAAGGSLREAEEQSRVPRSTLHHWLKHGPPPAVLQWLALTETMRRLGRRMPPDHSKNSSRP
jgi:hypothetical protein